MRALWAAAHTVDGTTVAGAILRERERALSHRKSRNMEELGPPVYNISP